MIRPRPAQQRRLASVLAGPAALYGAAVRWRNRRYDRGLGTHAATVPVISVGNITAGGTGKTPLVIDLARRLGAMQRRPCILTRGYGAQRGETADEVAEFADAVQAPVVVDADRVRGAQQAVGRHNADVLVLDDGFQHRRLERDLDVVVIDALDPWGAERMLPAGLLREPLDGLRRADLFVLSRANQVSPDTQVAITKRLRTLAPDTPVASAGVALDRVCGHDDAPLDANALRSRRLQPVCGLGNPLTFRLLVNELSDDVCTLLAFRDHHRYTPYDADVIAQAARGRGADAVVTTRKDWGKLKAVWPTNEAPLLVRVDVSMTWLEPRPLEAALQRVFDGCARP